MALIRMTEKKLAANRANARLSKGPITVAGKEKVSRSACKHHLYARKHLLPPSWEARIWERILPLVADIQDPVERQIKTDLAFHGQWSLQLDRLEYRLIDAHVARCGSDVRKGDAQYATQDPLFFQIGKRNRWLGRRIDRALHDLKRHRRILKERRTVPYLAENTVHPPAKVWAAAAGAPLPVSQFPATAEHSHISLIPNPRPIPISSPQHPIAGLAPAPAPIPAFPPPRTPDA